MSAPFRTVSPGATGAGPTGIVPMDTGTRHRLCLEVARVLGLTPIPHQPAGFFYWETPRDGPRSGFFDPTDDWDIAGPLLDKAMLDFKVHGPDHVEASYPGGAGFHAQNHRIAGMLCLVSDARTLKVFGLRG